MSYRIVQYGDGHWEGHGPGDDGETDNQLLWHWDERYKPMLAIAISNRYSTKELAMRAVEAAKRDDEWRQSLRDKHVRDNRVMKVIDV